MKRMSGQRDARVPGAQLLGRQEGLAGGVLLLLLGTEIEVLNLLDAGVLAFIDHCLFGGRPELRKLVRCVTHLLYACHVNS